MSAELPERERPERPERPERIVHCADARRWLAEREASRDWSFVTSLPDVSEMGGMSFDAWRGWFGDAAAQVLGVAAPDAVVVFYQTDVKRDGRWVDKGYLCQRAAEEVGSALLWHKVVCRKPPGTITFGRAGYAHLLCFSRALRPARPPGIPDVVLETERKLWTRGMGIEACLVACRYVLEETTTRTVVDPYAGRGTALAVANHLGLGAIGVELNAKRARQAAALVWGPAVSPPS